MNRMCVVDEICENGRITEDGEEGVWRQGRVEENGGEVWGRGERAEEESWGRRLRVQGRLQVRLQARRLYCRGGAAVVRVGIGVGVGGWGWTVACGCGRTRAKATVGPAGHG